MIRTNTVVSLFMTRIPRISPDRSLIWDYLVYRKRHIEKLESCSG